MVDKLIDCLDNFLKQLDVLQKNIIEKNNHIVRVHGQLTSHFFAQKRTGNGLSADLKRAFNVLEPDRNTYEVELNAIFYMRKTLTDFKYNATSQSSIEVLIQQLNADAEQLGPQDFNLYERLVSAFIVAIRKLDINLSNGDLYQSINKTS